MLPEKYVRVCLISLPPLLTSPKGGEAKKHWMSSVLDYSLNTCMYTYIHFMGEPTCEKMFCMVNNIVYEPMKYHWL